MDHQTVYTELKQKISGLRNLIGNYFDNYLNIFSYKDMLEVQVCLFIIFLCVCVLIVIRRIIIQIKNQYAKEKQEFLDESVAQIMHKLAQKYKINSTLCSYTQVIIMTTKT